MTESGICVYVLFNSSLLVAVFAAGCTGILLRELFFPGSLAGGQECPPSLWGFRREIGV